MNQKRGRRPEFTPGPRLGWTRNWGWAVAGGGARDEGLFPFPKVDVRGRVGWGGVQRAEA